MVVGRIFTGEKVPLAIGFAVLLVAAFGAGCSGFWVPNSLSAMTIQPVSPSIQVGQSQVLQAWGTYQDNTRKQITSGVEWTSSDTTVMTIGQTSGLAQAVTGGTSTITASAQGLSATASATAFFGTVNNFQVCLGTFGATTTCSSGASPLTWSVASGTSASFIAQGSYTTSQGQNQLADLTTSSTWNAATPTPSAGGIQCTNSGTSPETCQVLTNTPVGSYTFTVTYGTNSVATVTVLVTM
jgi:Bacterial Ig-like domain (group 2)